MKPLKLIFGILLLIGFAGSISLRADEGWTGDIGFGLAMARGNSDSSNVSFSFNANRDLTPVLHWKNNLYTIYSEKDGEKTTDTMGLSTKLEWNHTERTFSYYELQALRDYFKDYEYSLRPGIGIGFVAMTTPTKKLSFFGGLTQVYTKYRSTGETKDFTGLKLGNEFTWKVSETSEFRQKLEIIPEISDMSNYLAKLELGLTANITQSWALTATLLDNYDSEPPDPTLKKNDMNIMVGLSRKF